MKAIRAVVLALRERLDRVRAGRRMADDLDDIALRCSRMPVLDDQSAEQILGYDERGLPR